MALDDMCFHYNLYSQMKIFILFFIEKKFLEIYRGQTDYKKMDITNYTGVMFLD